MSSCVTDQLIDHFFIYVLIREVSATCQRDGFGEYTQTRTTMRGQHLIVSASSCTGRCIFICIYVVCSTIKYNLMHLLSCFYQIHMVSFSVCRVGASLLNKKSELLFFRIKLSLILCNYVREI
jgi:hypothetical protein